jgi:RNA polymerase sigma factor (sigma-70 family)
MTSQNESQLAQTRVMLDLARQGNEHAIDELFRIYRPRLERFLTARRPKGSRGLGDTQDLVQSVCTRAFTSLDSFEYRGVGSFWAFLRRIASNQIIDRVRTKRHNTGESLPEDSVGIPTPEQTTPLESAVRAEQLESYEAVVAALSEKERDTVLMRLELDAPFQLIASECGYPSPAAAKQALRRTLLKVAKEMRQHAR